MALVTDLLITSFSCRFPSLLRMRKFRFMSIMCLPFQFIRSNRGSKTQNTKPNFEFTTELSRQSNTRSSNRRLPTAFPLAIISLLVMSENPLTNDNTESNLSQQQQLSDLQVSSEQEDLEFPSLSSSQQQQPRRVTTDSPVSPGATVTETRGSQAATPLIQTSSSDSNDSQRSYSSAVTTGRSTTTTSSTTRLDMRRLWSVSGSTLRVPRIKV